MSEANPIDDSQIGTTSQDTEAKSKKGLFESMTIYDSLLILAFVFIVLATLRLFFVLRQYSESFPFGGGTPWSTGEYQWLMWF